MEEKRVPELPTHPKLRPVDSQWVEYQGQRLLHLRDTIGLARRAILVPMPLTPLLALCDGTRDERGLRDGLALRTGVQLSPSQVRDFVESLDAGLLLQNGAYERASAEALAAYRSAERREPSHADLVYPAEPAELSAALEAYRVGSPTPDGPRYSASARLAGVVCPHIDYERGGTTYAQLWDRCAPELEEVELAVIFGTNHAGGQGSLTLTRQSYATPLGVLPTDVEIVDRPGGPPGARGCF